MAQLRTDPRVIRTRKLIIDSFIELSGTKDFSDITVKDITAEAMINRATFYYHFEDKFDLLEKVLSEELSVNLNGSMFENSELDKESITRIFIAITNFQKSLHTRCQRRFEDTIARIIREQLEIIFYNMLCKQHQAEHEHTLKVIAVILSWGIYGASVEWRKNAAKISPEKFVKSVIPYITSGISSEFVS